MSGQNGKQGQNDRRQFAEAIAIANIPTLLAVLVQLTGEMRWLEDRYKPSRPHGMGDNDSGELPPPIQAEIREAALEAILAWRAGRPVALLEPSADLRLKLLSYVMAERVPAEYDSIIAEELAVLLEKEPPRIPIPPGFEVLIIGAGVSGLCAAINLKRAGIPFTILEKSACLGGIWRDNRYPGAGVDTPNHLYSFAN